MIVSLGSDYTKSALSCATPTLIVLKILFLTGIELYNLRMKHRGFECEGTGKTDVIRFDPTPARWGLIFCKERGTRFGYSLREVGVYR
jgi:hypothetical protein